MDPHSMMIIISIGTVVGWLAALYVEGALPGLIGHIVVATLGAFGGGYVSLTLLPQLGWLGMVPAGLAAAALLLYVVRLRRLRRPPEPEGG